MSFDMEKFSEWVKLTIDYNLTDKILWEKKLGHEFEKSTEIITMVIEGICKLFVKCCKQTPSPAVVDKFKEFVRSEIEVFSYGIFGRKKIKEYSHRAFKRETKSLVKKICNVELESFKKGAHDILETFIKNYLEFKEGRFTSKDDVYNGYVDVCRKEGISKPLPKVEFGKALRAHIPKIKSVRRRIRGKAVYGWNLELRRT